MERRIPKRWLARRYVFLAEVTGYTLSGIVGLIVLSTFLVKVEIIAEGSGIVGPVSTDIVADTDALLTEYLASTGDEVLAESPVCLIATDSADRLQALARRDLEATILALEQAPSLIASDTLTHARAAFATFPPNERGEEITTPESGMLRCLIDPQRSGVIPAGVPLARVYDVTRLVLDAPLGQSGAADMVAEGQVVRMELFEQVEGDGKGAGERQQLHGRVQTISTDGAAKRVVVYFADIPAVTREHFRSMLRDDGEDALPTVSVDIVVGHRSLFKDVFGRKQ